MPESQLCITMSCSIRVKFHVLFCFSSFSPAVAFLFADGASPNLPANSIRVVLVTIIKLVGEPMKSMRAPKAPFPFRLMGWTAARDFAGEAESCSLSPLNCGRVVIMVAAIC
uniref:Uncharacterized protein MANES_14G134800 n=1 Tax=Rhizophora mucronata TaxID=61149 RepID=A0A2P2KRP3_RHIMU